MRLRVAHNVTLDNDFNGFNALLRNFSSSFFEGWFDLAIGKLPSECAKAFASPQDAKRTHFAGSPISEKLVLVVLRAFCRCARRTSIVAVTQGLAVFTMLGE
jgi:hypothetical protein